jgi:hypothetical protein
MTSAETEETMVNFKHEDDAIENQSRQKIIINDNTNTIITSGSCFNKAMQIAPLPQPISRK